MDAAIYVIVGLLLGSGLVLAGMAINASGYLGKRTPPPPAKPGT